MKEKMFKCLARIQEGIRTRNRKQFWTAFVSMMGSLAAVATLATVVWYPKDRVPWWVIVIYVVAILGLCIWYAFWYTNMKNTIDIKVSDSLNVRVETCDILKAPDNNVTVVHVNEYFDTIVNEKIISADSLHGKFINSLFKNRTDELDEKIEKGLADKTQQIEVAKVVRKNGGKTTKYKIGTCIDFTEGRQQYVWVAFTHFNEDDHAYIEKYEYAVVLSKLFEYLSQKANGRDIYMNILGTGFSRLNKSHQFMLLYLLQNIYFMDSIPLRGTLHICVPSELSNCVNLNEIELYFKDIITGIDKL